MTPNEPTTAAEAHTPDPHRPRYHFSTPAGWLNDPNGLLFLDGEYHLFYQHYPDDIVWGPMHWGHAVSRDLLAWEQLPVALAPDEHGLIFSGSAVVDRADTAGFGPGAMVAVFTHDQEGRQSQSLAFSADRGRSWTKFAGNPVLPPPAGTPDFRDPRVFWYGAGGGAGHWVMALAVGRSIWLYTSPDLKAWTKTDEVGGRGAGEGVWECPDLVELSVDGGPETRWALMVSVQQGAPAGGSGQQYFVGDFDGERFTPAEGPEVVRWADYGADFYAAQSWGEAPGGRRIWLAWMNNWEYAKLTPATSWRGAMTLPRELALTRGESGLQLVQQPVAELEALREPLGVWQEAVARPGENLLAGVRGDALELLAHFAVDGATTAERFGLRVRVGAGEQATASYAVAQGQLYVDRGPVSGWAPGFAAPQVLALPPREGVVELRLLVDRSSLELFADGGRAVFTNQIFPAAGSQGVELFAEGGEVRLVSLQAYRLAQAGAGE